MTEADVEQRLTIAFQMLTVLRPTHPHCLVVPFGSVISGPGTPISDCDFALIRSPTPHLSHVLTGPRYFSPRLTPIVSCLEKKYGVLMTPREGSAPPPVPAHKVTPLSRAQSIKETRAMLEEIGKLIQGGISVTRVHSIPHARCPILKFYHKPTGLACDLSVDQW